MNRHFHNSLADLYLSTNATTFEQGMQNLTTGYCEYCRKVLVELHIQNQMKIPHYPLYHPSKDHSFSFQSEVFEQKNVIEDIVEPL